jgi:dephospho-CoA kinase
MAKILITGMSGTGKSTLIGALRIRGFRAIDLDEPGWSEYRDMPGSTEREWVWREDRVRQALEDAGDKPLFLSGCSINQVRFYAQFDHIVLLAAPIDVMLERVATRSTNPFGKTAAEREKIARDHRDIEPLLRAIATVELDGQLPVADLADAVVALIEAPTPNP